MPTLAICQVQGSATTVSFPRNICPTSLGYRRNGPSQLHVAASRGINTSGLGLACCND